MINNNRETIEKVQQLINDDTDFIVLYYNRNNITLEELAAFYQQLDSSIKPALGRPIHFICCDNHMKLESRTKEDIREMLYDEDDYCDFCGEEYVVISGSRMTKNALHKGCTANFCPKCGRKLKKDEG